MGGTAQKDGGRQDAMTTPTSALAFVKRRSAVPGGQEAIVTF